MLTLSVSQVFFGYVLVYAVLLFMITPVFGIPWKKWLPLALAAWVVTLVLLLILHLGNQILVG